MDETRATCAYLGMDEVNELFYLEGAPPTAKYPRPDVHAAARRVCAGCPVLAECAASAFGDAHTFRGGLSPEERAAFGGPLVTYKARHRDPRIRREQVWERIEFSPLPKEVMARVLAEQAAVSGPVRVRGEQDAWLPPAA